MAAGYAINKILGLAGEMFTDGKETLTALYLCNATDVTAGVALGTLTREGARLFGKRMMGGVNQYVP